jgi:two-component system NtrC family sensor kinase
VKIRARVHGIPAAFLLVAVAGLTYEAVLMFTAVLAPYRFPIPYAVPIFDTPFVLVATGVGYLCLERHRLRHDFQSAALGLSLWLGALLAVAHILTQPDYPGTPGFNPGLAPYLFFSSYLAAFTGVALALEYPRRALPLTDRHRWALGGIVVGLSVVIVAVVILIHPSLPDLVIRPGRMTRFAVWSAGIANGAVALWALARWWRRPRPDSQERAFATLLALATFVWLLGLLGLLLFPYRYSISWYLAGIARPLGVGIIFVALLREQVGLYAAARARLRDLEQLHRAGQALVTRAEGTDIIDSIARHGVAIAQADASILFRLDGDTLRAVTCCGLTHLRADDLTMPLGRGASGLAVQERRPISTPDVRTDPLLRLPPDVSRQLDREGLTGVLAVPLFAQRNEVFGALSVLYRHRRTFDDADVELLAAFGTQASVALESVRAFDRLALKATHDAALQEFGQHLLEAVDEREVVHEAVALAQRLLRPDGVALLLARPGGALRVAARAGFPDRRSDGAGVDPALDALAASALSGRELVERHGGSDASLAMPLGIDGEPMGALVVSSRIAQRFSDEEKRVLTSVAHQTAVALDKMRLYGELKDNLRRLQETQAQLIQADKLKALGTLLSGMAHELNNPISTIQLSVQLLKRVERVTGSIAHRVELIDTACRRASRIIRDLLVFARRQPPERGLVNVNDVVQSTLALQAPELQLNHIRVATALEPTPAISADANQLQQVFLNLFSNAIHAMRGAHGGGVLTVRSRRQGAEIAIEVEDTGPGIPPKDMGRIFDPFFTTKATGVGTGLGLSLAIGIIETHGGRLGVENVAGAGARFTVCLPAGTEASPRASAAQTTIAPATATAAADVLLVEDETSLRRALGDAVRELGYQVVEAATGREALARLRERTYDLVMLDLRLPDLDGQAVWQRALADDPQLAARVVFMTGDIMSAGTERFLEQTGRPFLMKPFTVEQLGRVIGEVLSPAT